MRSYESKILSVETMRKVRDQFRQDGRTLAFTNGCFDLIHSGHAELLAFARQQGDALVVGLNSDASVRSIKGNNRPIIPEKERARLLAAFEAVDYVVLFEEDRVDHLLSLILPDVLVKGADWKHDVHGREIVEQHNGRVVLAPVVQGQSTTSIMHKILASAKNAPE